MKDQIINSQQSLEAYKTFLDAQFEKHHYLRLTLKTGKQRTQLQNSSLHLLFTQIADALNDAGYDMIQVLAEGTNIPWSAEKVKDDIWRKVQLAMTGKKSTIKLERKEVNAIYEVISRHLGEKFGVFVPFPEDKDKNA